MQVCIKADWEKESITVQEFQFMCAELFEKEKIEFRLCDIIGSSVIVVCEVFMKDIEDVRCIICANKRQLHQQGISQIDLDYSAGSILVSFV